MPTPRKPSKKPQPKERKKSVQIRLRVDVIEKLDELAIANNTPRNSIIAIAISRLLESGL